MRMITKSFIIFLATFAVLFIISGVKSLEQGAVCTTNNGVSGICTALSNCTSARDGAKKGERSLLCSVRNKQAIVCCESSEQGKKYTPGKSMHLCAQYAEAVYTHEYSQVLSASPLGVREPVCTILSQPLITGGQLADEDEFPHMVALGFPDTNNKTQWLCGGSLISERYVLTVTHCLEHAGTKVTWALLGATNYSDIHHGAKLMRVVEWIPHPDYLAPTFNDIALVKLHTNVIFSPYLRPACLHVGNTTIRSKFTTTGWGSLGRDRGLSDHLMKVGLSIADSTKCNRAFRIIKKKLRREFEDDIMICAGDPRTFNETNTFKDTCDGDSGGTLQEVMTTPYCMYSIVGVTSYGVKGCGETPQPAIYTRVSPFVPWIESIVWPD